MDSKTIQLPDTITMDAEFTVSDFLSADDTELEFNIGDFSLDGTLNPHRTRYIKPKFYNKPTKKEYKNAVQLAREVSLLPGEQFHCIVKGDFIFGDFIEALVYEKNIEVENMYISTLSMSQDNIDSIEGMLLDGRIKRLTLILSNYFYSHEKHKLVKYLLEKCDIDNRLEVLIIRNHTKICLMEVSNIRLVMSGSSNLRSSESIEHFVLQENKDLYHFYKDWFDDNLQYSIIDREAKI